MCRTVISDIDGVYTFIDDGLLELKKLYDVMKMIAQSIFVVDNKKYK
jgi:hypothetical protein